MPIGSDHPTGPPPVQTTGAILIRDGRVLLGLRAAHKSLAGSWDVIGGHLEAGETPWTALCRELAEELDVRAAGGRLLARLVDRSADPPATLHVFLVHAWSGEPTIANDEHEELRWMRPAEAMELPNLASDEYRHLIAEVADQVDDRSDEDPSMVGPRTAQRLGSNTATIRTSNIQHP